MVIKYDMEIDNQAIADNLQRMTNQIFKLLPSREEGGDWQAPLSNLILELVGMERLLEDKVNLFSLLCKLEAMSTLTEEDDFTTFRRTVFECLGMCNTLKQQVLEGGKS